MWEYDKLKNQGLTKTVTYFDTSTLVQISIFVQNIVEMLI